MELQINHLEMSTNPKGLELHNFNMTYKKSHSPSSNEQNPAD